MGKGGDLTGEKKNVDLRKVKYFPQTLLLTQIA